MERYRIGIDLGGTDIKAGIVSADHQILKKTSCPTEAQRSWREIAGDMARLVRELMQQTGAAPSDCLGVGIGCPGTIDAISGRVIYSNNLAGRVDIPLAESIASALQLPMRISKTPTARRWGNALPGRPEDAAVRCC